jgi:hypothetical protein
MREPNDFDQALACLGGVDTRGLDDWLIHWETARGIFMALAVVAALLGAAHGCVRAADSHPQYSGDQHG